MVKTVGTKNDKVRSFRSMAEMLKCLAHPVRLMILMELSKGSKCVKDIQELFPKISQPTLSQHINILKRYGIIDYLQEGQKRCYYLVNPEDIKQIIKLVSKMLIE